MRMRVRRKAGEGIAAPYYSLLKYSLVTIARCSLVSHPYFSSCALEGERGRRKGRKNTSGKMCKVFVPKRNVIHQ